MRASVIIPVYNDLDRLNKCLASLRRQSVPQDDFEIIVVNNSSNSVSITDLAPNVKLFQQPKPGSYAARNMGASVARGAVLAFTDSDCIPTEYWLEAGIAEVEKNRNRHVTGPIEIFRVEDGDEVVYQFDRIFAFYATTIKGEVVTANLFVSESLFKYIGPFDELHYSGGDTEWNNRARSKGVAAEFSEQAVVQHPARASIADLIQKERRRAGAAAGRHLGLLRVMAKCIVPPFRKFKKADLRGINAVMRVRLFFVAWRLSIVYFIEYIVVSLHRKSARRS